MPILGYEDRIGVLPPKEDYWGVCVIEYSKTDTSEALVKCSTCVRGACCHVKSLELELAKDNGDDDALSLFQHALLAPPLLKMRFEKISTSHTKIPVFPGGAYLIIKFY